jgi:hypothetical protein
MKLDRLKEKQGLVSISLLCGSGVLGVLILARLGSFFVTSAKMEKLVEDAVSQSKADPNGAKEYLAKFRKAADELKKNNMFAPPPPKPGWPVSRVEGIAGDTAWINGGWRKVGDEIGGAKILEIGPTYVKVVWEGKEKIFYPFDVGTVPEPKKKAEKPVKKPKPKAKKAEEKPEEEEVVESDEDDPLAWMGVELSPKARAKLLEMWNNMSDEQKESAKEEWNNMSDEQKEEALKEMEEEV